MIDTLLTLLHDALTALSWWQAAIFVPLLLETGPPKRRHFWRPWLTELERRWTLCSLCLELSTQHWGIAIKGCVSVNLCCLCSGLKLPQCASCVLGTEKRATSCFAQTLLGNEGSPNVNNQHASKPLSVLRSILQVMAMEVQPLSKPDRNE